MSKHREIKSLALISHDVEINDESWQWFSSEVTPESRPYYVNRFIVHGLSETANSEVK